MNYEFDFSKYNNIGIFPHVNPDGDAIGSAVGMYLYLKKIGKKAVIVIDDEIEHRIKFLLDYAEFVDLEKGRYLSKDWDFCVTVDCGDISRLSKRLPLIEGKKFLNIDHHGTNNNFGTYNIVIPESPATCEIVCLMIETAGVEFDKEMAEALYTGLLTDTGSFMYESVTPQTLQLASRLLSTGMDKSKIIFNLYQNEKKELIALNSLAMSKLEFYENGKISLTYVDKEMLKETGATMADAGEISSIMRNIEGVEIGILLKEVGDEEGEHTKVSMRSLDKHDIMPIAEFYKGGGHRCAAGFSVYKNIKETKTDVLKTLKNMGY